LSTLQSRKGKYGGNIKSKNCGENCRGKRGADESKVEVQKLGLRFKVYKKNESNIVQFTST